MTDLTLDQWLSKLYQADLHSHLAVPLAAFKAALTADPEGLTVQAQARMQDLDDMIRIRGRKACAYSAKYDDYLHEALSP